MGSNPPSMSQGHMKSPHTQTKCQGGIHYGATAATKWTNTSLTSKEIPFFFR